MLEVVSRPILPHRVPSTELLRAGSFRIELIDRYRQQKGASRTRIFLNNFLRAGHLLRVLQGCPRAPVGVTSCCGPRPRTAPPACSGAGLAFWGGSLCLKAAHNGCCSEWLQRLQWTCRIVISNCRSTGFHPMSPATRSDTTYCCVCTSVLVHTHQVRRLAKLHIHRTLRSTGKADAMNAMRHGRQMKCATQCNGTGQRVIIVCSESTAHKYKRKIHQGHFPSPSSKQAAAPLN